MLSRRLIVFVVALLVGASLARHDDDDDGPSGKGDGKGSGRPGRGRDDDDDDGPSGGGYGEQEAEGGFVAECASPPCTEDGGEVVVTFEVGYAASFVADFNATVRAYPRASSPHATPRTRTRPSPGGRGDGHPRWARPLS